MTNAGEQHCLNYLDDFSATPCEMHLDLLRELGEADDRDDRFALGPTIHQIHIGRTAVSVNGFALIELLRDAWLAIRQKATASARPPDLR